MPMVDGTTRPPESCRGNAAFGRDENRGLRASSKEMRVMMRFRWLILAGAVLGSPSLLNAQEMNYEVPPVIFTGPLSHPRYEQGGFYCAIQGLYWRQNRPIRNETIAYRGFIDV